VAEETEKTTKKRIHPRRQKDKEAGHKNTDHPKYRTNQKGTPTQGGSRKLQQPKSRNSENAKRRKPGRSKGGPGQVQGRPEKQSQPKPTKGEPKV